MYFYFLCKVNLLGLYYFGLVSRLVLSSLLIVRDVVFALSSLHLAKSEMVYNEDSCWLTIF